MLQALRSSASNILLKGLMLLIVVSFAIWGVQGYLLSGSKGDAIVTIGDQTISGAEYRAAIDREMRTLQIRGIQIDREQARALGLFDQTLNQLIDTRVYVQGADELGMAVSDATVGEAIRSDPLFLGEDRKFSRSRFELIMQRSEFSEAAYTAEVRRDIIRRQIINSLDIPGVAPAAMVSAVHAWREETRVAELVDVKVDESLDVGEPTDAELEEIHNAQQARFTPPERRSILFVHLKAKDFLDAVEIPEEEVQAEYDSNIDKFTAPAKRIIQRIRFADEAAAKKGAEALAAGKGFEDVAREMTGEEGDALVFGAFAPGEIQIPAIAAAVEGLAEGETSQPVDTGLGWFIFRVSGTVPELVLPFEEVRENLVEAMKLERAGDVLYQTARDLEDTMAGGETLESAAAALGLTMRSTGPIDRKGLDVQGKPVADLPAGDFLVTAFESAEGEDSQLMETQEGGYYVLRVESIAPATLPPLEEIRDDVVAAWKEDKRLQAAQSRAIAMVERIEGGATLADVAAAEGLQITTAKPVNRVGRGDESGLITPVLVSDLFRLKPGQATMAEGDNGYTVARLKEIVPADPADTGTLAELLANGMVSDVLVQYNRALRYRYGVEIDNEALARVN